MPTTRRCNGKTAKGENCQATPRGEHGLCLWHDPDLADTAREARRLGGQRRKRELTVQAAYDIEGLGSIPEIRRIVTNLLGADNTHTIGVSTTLPPTLSHLSLFCEENAAAIESSYTQGAR